MGNDKFCCFMCEQRPEDIALICYECLTKIQQQANGLVDNHTKKEYKIAKLWNALSKYGKHGENCLGDVSGRKCTCGLAEALESAEDN
jgi:hypothetical protein